MSLEVLIDNTRTDKNTVHSYIPLYQTLLEPIKYSCRNVLEIGIYRGGSIKLWKDFFVNANIYGIDVMHINDVWESIKNVDRITLYTSNDAYDKIFFQKKFLSTNKKFDFILDDGPHTLDSQKKAVQLYSQVLSDNGILIVEDVQNINWIEELKSVVPENLKEYVKVYDLRETKNRYDDIVFTIDKYSTF